MRLLLNGGGSTEQLIPTMSKLNEIIDHNKPILYIPLAMDEIEHPYDECYEWFSKQIINVLVPGLDMARSFEDLASKNLNEYSAIFIGGGNTYKLLKGLLEEKYSGEDLVKRIIVTTDKVKGSLREEVNKVGYPSFVIPDDVGGRYSIMTAAHLFPLSFNIELEDFLNGYYSGEDLRDDAFKYAATRVALYNSGKVVENYVTYEENMYYFTEWLKQLYGESEGKEGVGIFPVSTVHTRDLHSLGQYVQEGKRLMFETVINVVNPEEVVTIEEAESDLDGINYLAGTSLDFVNKKAMQGTILAHVDGGVPNGVINLDKIDAKHIGYLLYFFMFSCGLSCYMLDINPFNQPGVESYKKNMFALLGKKGFEELKKELEKRL